LSFNNFFVIDIEIALLHIFFIKIFYQ